MSDIVALGREMLVAFAEGVVWNPEQRAAYEAFAAALSLTPSGDAEGRAREIADHINYVKSILVAVFEKRGKLRDGVLSRNVNIAAHRLEDLRAIVAALTPPPAPTEAAGLREALEALRGKPLMMPDGQTIRIEYPNDMDWARSWTTRGVGGGCATGEQDWELVEQFGLTAIVEAILRDVLAALAKSPPAAVMDGGPCAFDGKPCYVGGGTDDAHYRCGTSACPRATAPRPLGDVREAARGRIGEILAMDLDADDDSPIVHAAIEKIIDVCASLAAPAVPDREGIARIIDEQVEAIMDGFSFSTLIEPENLRARLKMCASGVAAALKPGSQS